MKKIDAMGKAKFVSNVHDNDSGSDDISDYSESMARSATANLTNPSSDRLRWNIDSGTTNSLVPVSTALRYPSSSSLSLRTENNDWIAAVGKGFISVEGLPDVTAHQVIGLAEPLISVSDITDTNHGVLFLNDRVLSLDNPSLAKSMVEKEGIVVAAGHTVKRSYYIENSSVSFRASQSSSASMLTWHLWLGHLSLQNLQDLRRRGEIEVTMDDVEEVIKCEHLVRGKFNRLNMKSWEVHRVSRKLDCIHSDLCQLPIKSMSGAR